MSAITTHVLDTARGCPASGVAVTLWHEASANDWKALGHGETDADGRQRSLLKEDEPLAAGRYRLTFETGPYFVAQNVEPFFPEIAVTFFVRNPSQHYHVPVLLSPFGYATYRGT